jgi:transmembrane sensor
MSRTRDNEIPTEAAEAAARWLMRLQDPAASGEDWLAFEQWLAAAPVHLEAYEKLEAVWGELDDRGAEITAALDAPVDLAAWRATRAESGGLSRRTLVAAGSLMAASVAVGVVGVSRLGDAPGQAYATTLGQTRRLRLADGTQVWLNAQSRLNVAMSRDVRRVRMTEGEAVFDVAHDPARPFLIDTGAREVRVVGTRFNLRQRPGAFALTVSHGVVEVRRPDAPQAAPTRLTAGQRLTHRRGAHPVLSTPDDPDTDFAWTEGRLIYADAPLAEVAADLSRSLGLRVRPADPETADLRVTGVLALDDRKTALRRLEAAAPVRAEQGLSGVVLRRR